MPPTSSTLAAGTHTPKWVAELSSSIFLFACSIVAAEEVRTAIQAVALAVLASGHASMRQAARLAASRAPVIVREYVPHFNLGRIIPNRHGNKLRRRLDWAAHVRDLTGQEFVRRYKLPPKAFRALVRKLSPALRKDPKYARNAGTEPIAVVLNVALTLRFLAGARMIELVDIFGLDAATVRKTAAEVVVQINMHHRFPIQSAEDLSPAALQAHADTMYARNKGTLHGCIGALDGMCVRILKPRLTCTPNPLHYLNRKGFFSMNLQAIADGDRRFLYMSLATAGGTHDSLAWSVSSLGHHLRNCPLPEGFWIAGDDAYACSSSLVSPYSSQACRKDNTKDDFNHYLSKSRINVECAFGILVRRFGVLRIPMGYSLKNIAAITEACMKLHNICIDNLVEETKPLEEDCTHKDHCGRARRQDKHAFPAPEGNKKRQNEAKRVALWHSIVARGLKRPKVKAGDLKRKRKQPA